MNFHDVNSFLCFGFKFMYMLSGPEVIKLFPCSSQLSMKFFLFINVKMPTIVDITFHIIFDSVTMAKTMIIGTERKNKIRA